MALFLSFCCIFFAKSGIYPLGVAIAGKDTMFFYRIAYIHRILPASDQLEF